MIETVNPATGQSLISYPISDAESLQEHLNYTWNEFLYWSRTEFSERAECILKLASLLRDDTESNAELITEEMGKPIKEARAEVLKCAGVLEYYAANAEGFLASEEIQLDDGVGTVAYKPLGGILAVMPWNFPYWQVFRFAAPAIMAGNVCVLKHAENVSACAIRIESLFVEAGFPERVFSSLLIPVELVQVVINHPTIHAVTLTGSERAGRAVASQAGAALKKTVLELGGSDPFIILDDAPLEPCVKAAVKARLFNCGQSCIASKRFIIPKKIEENFIALLSEELSHLHIGDPMDEKTDLGPMAREDLLVKLHSQVHRSIKKGAKLHLGGTRLAGPGFFYPPTILSNVKPDMPAYDEELFGPVFSIISVDSDEEAFRIANDTPYGLGATVWTNDKKKADAFANGLEAGSVFINSQLHSNAALPFGGTKLSGYGRELSHHGIREFCNIKTIVHHGKL